MLLAAFIEGIFMVNFYFPGSLVIALSVFLAPKTLEGLGSIGMATWIGFVLAAFFNYFLGAFGFYRTLLWMGKRDVIERMRRWMDKRGRSAIFLAAVHPNVLAISQVCMGIAREGIGYMAFFSAVALAIWIPFWTILLAIFAGRVNFEDKNQAWYVVGILVVWGFILVLLEEYRKSKRSEKRPNRDSEWVKQADQRDLCVTSEDLLAILLGLLSGRLTTGKKLTAIKFL